MRLRSFELHRLLGVLTSIVVVLLSTMDVCITRKPRTLRENAKLRTARRLGERSGPT